MRRRRLGRRHGQLPASSKPVTKSTRPHVVLVCYACVPGLGSEPGAGWAWTRAASEIADVTLITAPSPYRPRVEEAISDLGAPITVCWVGDEDWLGWLLRSRPLGMVRYGLWQARAGLVVRRLERDGVVDVVHHLTWASDSLPSALLASTAPVRIWGPVGGCTRTSWGLYRYLTARGMLAEIIRDLMNGAFRISFGSMTARRATLLVAMNEDGRARWGDGPTPVVVESNVAILPSDLAVSRSLDVPMRGPNERVALFVGRLIPWKGLSLAVAALAHAPGWRLVVFGDGPDRLRAEALAQRIGVADRVEYRDRVARATVLSALCAADALLFPSFHDSAGWAVGEASALGCPVVCLDAGGPAMQAGRNAHVVPAAPAGSLDRRIGRCLLDLPGRGEPDDHLSVDRIPAILEGWYNGAIAAGAGTAGFISQG